MKNSWRTASRKSAGLVPDAATTKEPVIQVYAARTYGWRGAFAVHTWIAVKSRNALSYTIYQIVGWNITKGTTCLSVSDDLPDRYWYGNRPEIILDIRGKGVDRIIMRLIYAVRMYPYAYTYVTYPGPNSNTFTAWISRNVPELKLDLPPTAIGKDFIGNKLLAKSPSGTGYQASIFGLFGVLISVEEGLEFSIGGLTFGINLIKLSLKLPIIGRIGPKRRFNH